MNNARHRTSQAYLLKTKYSTIWTGVLRSAFFSVDLQKKKRDPDQRSHVLTPRSSDQMLPWV